MALIAFFISAPVLKQTLRRHDYSRVARFSPRVHARADRVDQRYLYKDSWIIEAARIRCCRDVTGRSPLSFLQFETPRLPLVLPELHRFVVRRIDDEVCDSFCHVTSVSELDIRA